jgi:hypothetical protein
VSISTLREVEQPQHPATSAVGLDWGVASFVSMSNGEVIEQLQPLKKFLPRLAKGLSQNKVYLLSELCGTMALWRSLIAPSCLKCLKL